MCFVAALFAALNGAPASASTESPDVAHLSARTTPIQGAVAQSSRRLGDTLSVTRVIVLDGATSTASSTQPAAVHPMQVAYLTTLRCKVEEGRPHGCRTVTNHAYEVLPGDLVIDPLLRSATLDVGSGNERLRVSWTASGELSTSATRWTREVHGDPSAGDLWWEAEAQAALTLVRDAEVGARLGSRRFTFDRHSSASVFRSMSGFAGQSACLTEAYAPC